MDYSEVIPRMGATEGVLRRALGHLTEHCKCRGGSLCVACELASDAWGESERLRDLRSRIAAFLDAVDHTLRCVGAFALGPEDAPVTCPVCAEIAEAAQGARHA